jgi:hypothetical protein
VTHIQNLVTSLLLLSTRGEPDFQFVKPDALSSSVLLRSFIVPIISTDSTTHKYFQCRIKVTITFVYFSEGTTSYVQFVKCFTGITTSTFFPGLPS